MTPVSWLWDKNHTGSHLRRSYKITCRVVTSTAMVHPPSKISHTLLQTWPSNPPPTSLVSKLSSCFKWKQSNENCLPEKEISSSLTPSLPLYSHSVFSPATMESSSLLVSNAKPSTCDLNPSLWIPQDHNFPTLPLITHTSPSSTSFRTFCPHLSTDNSLE